MGDQVDPAAKLEEGPQDGSKETDPLVAAAGQAGGLGALMGGDVDEAMLAQVQQMMPTDDKGEPTVNLKKLDPKQIKSMTKTLKENQDTINEITQTVEAAVCSRAPNCGGR